MPVVMVGTALCVEVCGVFLHVSARLTCPLHPQDTGPAVTPGPALCAEARGAAQRLLDHYVQVQGAAVAQMLRKSVETRDWLGTVEPRNVRAVMKRVVEDITAIDVQVGPHQEPRGAGGGPEIPWGVPAIPEGPWRGPEVPIRSLRTLGSPQRASAGVAEVPWQFPDVPEGSWESWESRAFGGAEGSRGDA